MCAVSSDRNNGVSNHTLNLLITVKFIVKHLTGSHLRVIHIYEGAILAAALQQLVSFSSGTTTLFYLHINVEAQLLCVVVTDDDRLVVLWKVQSQINSKTVLMSLAFRPLATWKSPVERGKDPPPFFFYAFNQHATVDMLTLPPTGRSPNRLNYCGAKAVDWRDSCITTTFTRHEVYEGVPQLVSYQSPRAKNTLCLGRLENLNRCEWKVNGVCGPSESDLHSVFPAFFLCVCWRCCRPVI